MASTWRRTLSTWFTRSTGYRLQRAVSPVRGAGPTGKGPVRLVVATTHGFEDFHAHSTLGRSLAAIPGPLRPELTVFADNTGAGVRGLPTLYNQALDEASDDEILVLVHDDVHLHDWYIASRAREAMGRFDLAGVAGAVRSNPADPSWYFTYGPGLVRGRKQPAANLSGAINHGPREAPTVQVYGRAPASCTLLDGVLMIVHAGRARAAGVRFDEQFRFHLYDLDFCRSATQAGLRVGTWPISISHDSRGAWDSAAFATSAGTYLAKWPAP